MRQDQFQKLQDRAEQLADVFLEESDRATWPGAGIPVANMDRDTRGDRYWCKKNAAATIGLMQRIVSLIDTVRRKTAGDTPPTDPDQVKEGEDELAAIAEQAEREAARLVDKARKKRGGAA